jgi:hypothetical protein
LPWEQNEPYRIALLIKGRSGGASTRHLYGSGTSSTGDHILYLTSGTTALFGIYRWGWGFSTSQDFNGDIALIACFASAWTAAMVRRWHADPFGFLRP